MGRILCPAASGTLPPTDAIALDTGTPDRQLVRLPAGVWPEAGPLGLHKILYKY